MNFITDPWFYVWAIPAVIITGISKTGLGAGVGGVAVGMFCGLIPGPFQMLGAALCCVLFRVNLPLALFMSMALFAFVIWAMWDMYAWGYKYGHDLDPRAAIKVEGMAYQPPLFGHKKLLNFDAWSLPDTGGWILFAVISLACLVWFIEWRWPTRSNGKPGNITLPSATAALIPLLLTGLITSCAPSGPPTIELGKTECAHCRMNVTDPHFAAAIVTRHGRTYVYDSPECMIQQVTSGTIAEDQVAQWWVSDDAHPGQMIDARTAFYLHAPGLHSPMNGNVAAFASSEARVAAEAHDGGEELDWSATRDLLGK